MIRYSPVNYHSLGRVYPRFRQREPFVLPDLRELRRAVLTPNSVIVLQRYLVLRVNDDNRLILLQRNV